jgi:hypothetical protein
MKTSREYSAFNKAMDAILRADPQQVKDEMEREKQENAAKRKAKKSSASGRASRAKGV